MRAGGKYFLLIGYSFGPQRDGRIDDAESFEFLGELLKRFRRQIVIVDPTLVFRPTFRVVKVTTSPSVGALGGQAARQVLRGVLRPTRTRLRRIDLP
jgi:hypothetical protein